MWRYNIVTFHSFSHLILFSLVAPGGVGSSLWTSSLRICWDCITKTECWGDKKGLTPNFILTAVGQGLGSHLPISVSGSAPASAPGAASTRGSVSTPCSAAWGSLNSLSPAPLFLASLFSLPSSRWNSTGGSLWWQRPRPITSRGLFPLPSSRVYTSVIDSSLPEALLKAISTGKQLAANSMQAGYGSPHRMYTMGNIRIRWECWPWNFHFPYSLNYTLSDIKLISLLSFLFLLLFLFPYWFSAFLKHF